MMNADETVSILGVYSNFIRRHIDANVTEEVGAEDLRAEGFQAAEGEGRGVAVGVVDADGDEGEGGGEVLEEGVA